MAQPLYLPNAFSVASPALVTLGDTLFAAWVSSGNGSKVLFSKTTFPSLSVWDQAEWSTPLAIPFSVSDAEPSLAVFENMPITGDLLYAVWKGQGRDASVYCSIFINSYWSEPQLIPNITTSAAPTLIYFQQQLYLFFMSAQNGISFCSLSAFSTWSSAIIIPEMKTWEKPAVTATYDRIYVATGDSPFRLITVQSFDGTGWATQVFTPFVTRSITSPALTSIFGTIWVSWKAGSDENPWVTVPASSDQSLHYSSGDGVSWASDEIAAGVWTDRHPALVMYDGVLFVAWTEPTPLQPICWAPLLELNTPHLQGQFFPGSPLATTNRGWFYV